MARNWRDLTSTEPVFRDFVSISVNDESAKLIRLVPLEKVILMTVQICICLPSAVAYEELLQLTYVGVCP